ncbi:major facilitator superfamily domain-containing protein [Spinellus fusiger]|nr:major facilitator superfamily domain-containing protein [Spinellus fusiger]
MSLTANQLNLPNYSSSPENESMVHTLISDEEGSFIAPSIKHSSGSTKSSITAAGSIHSIEPTKEQFSETPPPYSSFSKAQKMSIVAMAAFSSFFSPFSANIYFPALNMIQQDLHTTTDLINLTVTVYMVFQGVSPSFWGGLADNWGRRPVYIMTILIYIIACIGIALAPDYNSLLGLRMLQAFGSSSVIAIGAGTIGDVAVPAERAGYMGMYSMGTMMGPILGPVLGGILSHQLSMEMDLLATSYSQFCSLDYSLFFLPETLRKLVVMVQAMQTQHPFNGITAVAGHGVNNDLPTPSKSRFLVLPNPLQSVLYLLEKDVAVVLLYNSLQYAGFYSVLTSMTHLSPTSITSMSFRLAYVFLPMVLVLAQFPIERARMSITWIWGIAFNIAMIIYGWLLHLKAPIIPVLSCKPSMSLGTVAVVVINPGIAAIRPAVASERNRREPESSHGRPTIYDF